MGQQSSQLKNWRKTLETRQNTKIYIFKLKIIECKSINQM